MGMSFFQASAKTAGCLLKANPWPIRVEFSITASRRFLSTEVPSQSGNREGSSVGWIGPQYIFMLLISIFLFLVMNYYQLLFVWDLSIAPLILKDSSVG